MARIHPIPYSGSTPGADSNTYVLFTSTAETALQNGGIQLQGLSRYLLSLKNSGPGTLRGEGSNDGGTTWTRFFERNVPAASPLTNEFRFPTQAHRDVRVLWVNGGAAQSTWLVAQALDNEAEVQPSSPNDNVTYIVNGDMSADINGPSIAVGQGGRLLAHILWNNTGTPIGTISLQALCPDGATWIDINGASAEFATQVNNNNASILCAWRGLELFTQVRIKYTRTSGGTSNTSFNVDIRTA